MTLMEQLVFDLASPEPPSFANFVPGRNTELLAALARIAGGTVSETGLFIWGAAGAGKTHLLRAAIAAVVERGARASFVAEPGALLATDPELLAECALVAIDAIDTAQTDAQGHLFTLFNALKARGGHLVAASRAPLAALPLREDLRTRLGWGLVYELAPLADADKPAALTAYARARGFGLSGDAIDYLLVHGRRDMSTLLGALAALDRHSLATKRPITVAMLREWLQREVPLESRDTDAATRQ
jgi:DnaA family protein